MACTRLQSASLASAQHVASPSLTEATGLIWHRERAVSGPWHMIHSFLSYTFCNGHLTASLLIVRCLSTPLPRCLAGFDNKRGTCKTLQLGLAQCMLIAKARFEKQVNTRWLLAIHERHLQRWADVEAHLLSNVFLIVQQEA